MNNYFLIVFAIAVFALGFICGIISQQIALKNMAIEVVSNLEGVEINIDFNETQMINGITNFYEPYLDEIVNNSQKVDNGK